MPHASPARLARVLVYGSLALGFGIALYPPQSLSRQKPDPHEALTAKDRATYHAIFTRYLSSLPGGAPAPALASLTTTEDTTLSRLITWLPLPPDQRPGLLFATGLPQDTALFSSLLKTSLIGIKPPPLTDTPRILEKLPLEKADPLRLQLLQALATRAETDQATLLQLQFLAQAARHPTATWTEVQTLIDTALATQQIDEATGLLNDWLDDPPAPQDPAQLAHARRQLARLHLTARQLPQALAALQPLLQPSSPPDLPTLDIAWTLASLGQDPTPLIPLIETALRQHPQQHLHWRELTNDPPPSADYLTWLTRLSTASLQAKNESRALETALHLARLDTPSHLLPVLPAAARLGRLPEVLDLLDLIEDGPAPHIELAQASYQNQDLTSARHLLEHHLKNHPRDLPALRLLLQVKTHDLPAMQSAIFWRRHLQQHPSDLPAQHHLIAAWLSAHQPQAAVNHLLATDPTHLDTALRLQTAQLALENRQNAAFPRAIRRLLDAKDPVPADSLPLWTQHLHALGHSSLAKALR
jgi:tetratricopeptide (TPR) repeat protein